MLASGSIERRLTIRSTTKSIRARHTELFGTRIGALSLLSKAARGERPRQTQFEHLPILYMAGLRNLRQTSFAVSQRRHLVIAGNLSASLHLILHLQQRAVWDHRKDDLTYPRRHVGVLPHQFVYRSLLQRRRRGVVRDMVGLEGTRPVRNVLSGFFDLLSHGHSSHPRHVFAIARVDFIGEVSEIMPCAI